MSVNTNSACILAIETSCDDTSVAVLKDNKMLANVTVNQHIHSKYGGVVPELASRNHEKNMLLAYTKAMEHAKIQLKEIDAIAFTQGPGLLGALLVGTSFAKSLALALDKPLIAVNHLHAHVAALYIANPKPAFPFIALLVSGGHTQILWAKDYFSFELLGKTLDDAAGEAFDKIGKMLNLPYPAGPMIDQMAKKGNPLTFSFTYSKVPGYNYSFSGFKTQVLYFIQKNVLENPDFIADNILDLCASIQFHICTYLLKPIQKILCERSVKGLAVVGGVSANSALRTAVQQLAKEQKIDFMVPAFEYCTDNAGMIAQAAWFKYQNHDFVGLEVIAQARPAVNG